MNLNEESWITTSPGRKNDIIDALAVLLAAEVESFVVDEKFRQVKKIWRKKETEGLSQSQYVALIL